MRRWWLFTVTTATGVTIEKPAVWGTLDEACDMARDYLRGPYRRAWRARVTLFRGYS